MESNAEYRLRVEALSLLSCDLNPPRPLVMCFPHTAEMLQYVLEDPRFFRKYSAAAEEDELFV